MKTQAQVNQVSFDVQNFYCGIDVHKKSWTVTIETDDIRLKTFSQNPDPVLLSRYLKNHYPGGTYIAGYEAGYFGFGIQRKLSELGIECQVLHAADIPTTHKEKDQKRDPRDSKKIARTLRTDSISPIWVPSKQQESDRQLIRTRKILVNKMTRVKTQLKSFLVIHDIAFPPEFSESIRWSNKFIKWLSEIQLEEESGTHALSSYYHELVFLRSELARLELEFVDPRGFIVDNFSLPIYPQVIEYKHPIPENPIMKVEEKDDFLLVTSNNESYKISTKTGLITCNTFTGPYLMILPMNNGGDTQMNGPTKYYEPYTPVCTEWDLDSVENLFYQRMEIKVYGTYKEAKGCFTYKIQSSGDILINYDFELLEDINPRQMGLVFDLPKVYENLSWKRKGYWSTYPEWHIARLEGTAKASEGFDSTPVGPRTKPDHEWRLDRTAIGSNDFASTKHNIYKPSLSDNTGKGLEVRSMGKLNSRSWIEGSRIHWLIANYSNGGSERFLRPHAEKDDIYLKVGDEVKGSIFASSS